MVIPKVSSLAPNQYVVHLSTGEVIFQSYDTIVAIWKAGKVTLDTSSLHYSNTTSKYLYRFLDMTRKEIEKGIKSKEIKMKDLNKA